MVENEKSLLEYQREASRTIKKNANTNELLVEMGIGIIGEAGEVVNEIKKIVFHEHNVNKEKIKEELGDTLWYISGMCSVLGLSLEEVAIQNIDKSKKRYPNGFSRANSVNRRE